MDKCKCPNLGVYNNISIQHSSEVSSKDNPIGVRDVYHLNVNDLLYPWIYENLHWDPIHFSHYVDVYLVDLSHFSSRNPKGFAHYEGNDIGWCS